ncbi:hypothetical protein SIA70_13575 [Bacillus subtilis]|uniref:DUF6941 family protein n=1 Tax=Bacillus subtilis TaxID=1423 RepID=UPI0029C1E276|nr:hypothetical protein [Bacillus subtilis]MDX6157137.1 hypothetical protein [Bacillus subtilis]
MPRISSFMYCAIDDEGNNEMTTSINPDYIPGNYTFYSTFSIVDLKADRSYLLRLEFKDPNEEQVFITEDQKLESPVEDKVKKKHVGVLVNFEYKNVPLKQEGLYTTAVYVDNELIGDFTIPVYKGREDNE